LWDRYNRSMGDVRGALNERQLAVLRWIRDGCPAGVMTGHTYKTTALALQGRRMVVVMKRRGVWSATVTESGLHYLLYGRLPDRPDKARAPDLRQRTNTRRTVPPAPANTSAGPGTAAPKQDTTMNDALELIRRLRSDHGTFRIEDPEDGVRRRYRKAIHAAKQHGLVPAGHTLRHTGRNNGDLIVCLFSDDLPHDTEWNRLRLKKRGSGRAAVSGSTSPAGDSLEPAADDVLMFAEQSRRKGPVDRLIDDLRRAGGVLTVPRPNWVNGVPDGVDYETLVASAVQHRKVPAGMRLTTKTMAWPNMEVHLEPAIPGTEVELRPVPVPDRVMSYHPTVVAFRHQSDRHEVSPALLQRTCRILNALVIEGEGRGYTAAVASGPAYDPYARGWASSRDGHLVFAVNGSEHALRIVEHGMPRRSQWARTHGPRSPRYPTSGGDGRLRLELLGYAFEAGRSSRWNDGVRVVLEDKLPAVLAEMEIRSAERAHRAQEQARQEADRKRRRELAVERATLHFVEADKAQHLVAVVERWELAARIRLYLDAMRAEITARGARPETQAEVEAALEWLAWAEQHIVELDPLNGPIRTPVAPTATSEALRPFLEETNNKARIW
jgi:hypothetical protein